MSVSLNHLNDICFLRRTDLARPRALTDIRRTCATDDRSAKDLLISRKRQHQPTAAQRSRRVVSRPYPLETYQKDPPETDSIRGTTNPSSNLSSKSLSGSRPTAVVIIISKVYQLLTKRKAKRASKLQELALENRTLDQVVDGRSLPTCRLSDNPSPYFINNGTHH